MGTIKKSTQTSNHTVFTEYKPRSVKHIRISEAQKVYDVYDFKEEIGHGAFGVVVLGIEKSNNREWAIKIVSKNIAAAGKLMEVDNEIKILKLVDHPNIVLLDKVYESPKKIYMILERCKNELFQVYMLKKPFTEKTCRKIMTQLTSAIAYLHQREIVHRDIKMENILLGPNPQDPTDENFIKLTDFGLSIVKTGAGIQGMLKQFCGTHIYMPPEILQMKSYSELCDVWAMGVILYMMLYGKFPFYSSDEAELANMICKTEPQYPSGVNSDAIDLLKGILEKNPVQRMTALQAKEHPWLDKHNKNARRENILDVMKRFRVENDNRGGEVPVRALSVGGIDLFDYSNSILSAKKPSVSGSARNKMSKN